MESRATAASERSSTFRAIVGEEHLRAATPEDAVDGVVPSFVVEPADSAQTGETLKAATAAGLSVVPRGGGSKIDWGATPQRADVVLSTLRMNRVLQHAWADMTVVVESGCTIAELQRTLAEHGQRLAVDALWPERATVGGILSTNDSGALRVRYGSLRDLVIGTTVALADGTRAMSGGRVVKNVAGYDLPKLMTGAMGTLGVITEAVFRLYPLPRATRSVSFNVQDGERVFPLMLAALDSQLVFTGLQIRGGMSGEMHLDARFEGTWEGVEAQLAGLRSVSDGFRFEEVGDEVWRARQAVFDAKEPNTMIVKVGTQPGSFAALHEIVSGVANRHECSWQLVAQAVGTAWLRVDGEQRGLAAVLSELREGLLPMRSSAVVQQCPLELKKEIDVWGAGGNSLSLMRKVKERFDPSGTLNPGRFVGGI